MIVCWFSLCFFFFKQKTAYEMRISDWSSDVCSSDLTMALPAIIESDRENSDWIEFSGSEPVIEIVKERNGKGGVPQWLPTIARFDGYQFFRIEGSALHQRRISQLTVNPRGGADAP